MRNTMANMQFMDFLNIHHYTDKFCKQFFFAKLQMNLFNVKFIADYYIKYTEHFHTHTKTKNSLLCMRHFREISEKS